MTNNQKNNNKTWCFLSIMFGSAIIIFALFYASWNGIKQSSQIESQENMEIFAFENVSGLPDQPRILVKSGENSENYSNAVQEIMQSAQNERQITLSFVDSMFSWLVAIGSFASVVVVVLGGVLGFFIFRNHLDLAMAAIKVNELNNNLEKKVKDMVNIESKIDHASKSAENAIRLSTQANVVSTNNAEKLDNEFGYLKSTKVLITGPGAREFLNSPFYEFGMKDFIDANNVRDIKSENNIISLSYDKLNGINLVVWCASKNEENNNDIAGFQNNGIIQRIIDREAKLNLTIDKKIAIVIYKPGDRLKDTIMQTLDSHKLYAIANVMINVSEYVHSLAKISYNAKPRNPNIP